MYPGYLFVMRVRRAEHWETREPGVRGVAMATPLARRAILPRCDPIREGQAQLLMDRGDVWAGERG